MHIDDTMIRYDVSWVYDMNDMTNPGYYSLNKDETKGKNYPPDLKYGGLVVSQLEGVFGYYKSPSASMDLCIAAHGLKMLIAGQSGLVCNSSHILHVLDSVLIRTYTALFSRLWAS